MADITNLSSFLGDVADAIRSKKGSEESIPAKKFDEEILSIETGIDTSDADATEENIEKGKTAYVNGLKVTGTLADAGGSADIMVSADNISVGNQRGWDCVSTKYTNSGKKIHKDGWYVNQHMKFEDLAPALGVTADKIVAGNTILGVEGTATGGGTVATEGAKLFETIEEMNADTTAKTGDKAEVYSNTQSYLEVGTMDFSNITLSKSFSITTDEYEGFYQGTACYGDSGTHYLSIYFTQNSYGQAQISVYDMNTQTATKASYTENYTDTGVTFTMDDTSYTNLLGALRGIGEINISQIDNGEYINKILYINTLVFGIYEHNGTSWVARNIGTTASASDVLSGKKVFSNNQLLLGTKTDVNKTNAMKVLWGIPSGTNGGSMAKLMDSTNYSISYGAENGDIIALTPTPLGGTPDIIVAGEGNNTMLVPNYDIASGYIDYVGRAWYSVKTTSSSQDVTFNYKNATYTVTYTGTSKPSSNGRFGLSDGIAMISSSLYGDDNTDYYRLSDKKHHNIKKSSSKEGFVTFRGKLVYLYYDSGAKLGVYDFDTEQLSTFTTGSPAVGYICPSVDGVYITEAGSASTSTHIYKFEYDSATDSFKSDPIVFTASEAIVTSTNLGGGDCIKFLEEVDGKIAIGRLLLHCDDHTITLQDPSEIGEFANTMYGIEPIWNREGYFTTVKSGSLILPVILSAKGVLPIWQTTDYTVTRTDGNYYLLNGYGVFYSENHNAILARTATNYVIASNDVAGFNYASLPYDDGYGSMSQDDYNAGVIFAQACSSYDGIQYRILGSWPVDTTNSTLKQWQEQGSYKWPTE